MKFYCFITGYNYNAIRNYDSWSRRKVGIFAISILFPTLIWILNGFILTTKILKGSIINGIIVAVICGAIIFFIERVIIMSLSVHRAIRNTRFVLAFCMAFLGSFALKEVIFDKDIEKELNGTRPQRALDDILYRKDIRIKIKEDSLDIENLKIRKQYMQDSAIREIQGGPGRPAGHGPKARYYEQQAKKISDTLLPLAIAKQDSLRAQNEHDILKRTDELKNEDAGLLTRISAFTNVVKKDVMCMVIVIILFIALTCLELIVLILKKYLLPSNYEKDEKKIANRG